MTHFRSERRASTKAAQNHLTHCVTHFSTKTHVFLYTYTHMYICTILILFVQTSLLSACLTELVLFKFFKRLMRYSLRCHLEASVCPVFYRYTVQYIYSHALVLASFVDLCHIMTQFTLNALSWMPALKSAVDRGHSRRVQVICTAVMNI